MFSCPSAKNNRDIEVPVFSQRTDHLSRIRKEVIMIFYSGVEEVKNVEDIIKSGCKIIVLMRGLPGSGKSTLAHYLMETSADKCTTKEKHIFSADDFFTDPKSNAYTFNRDFLREAHFWNIEGVLAAAQTNVTPIIVDNTNLTVSEMWPYTCIAVKYDYIVRYLEPNTHWRYSIHECARRNLHGVSEKHIASMMGRFDRSVSVSELLGLVSSRINFKKYGDSHSNYKGAISKYNKQKHLAGNRKRQLRSICTYNDKISKRCCIQAVSSLPNISTVLLDPTNLLGTLRTSRNLVKQQLVCSSLPTNSGLIEFPISGGFLSLQKCCHPPNKLQTCISALYQNKIFDHYSTFLKLRSFLHLLVSLGNFGLCNAQLMSINEIHKELKVEKYRALATNDSLCRCGCISRNNLRMTLTVEHGMQPSVIINNVKTVVLPTNIKSLLLPARQKVYGNKGVFEAYIRNKEKKISHIFLTETDARFLPISKKCNVEESSTHQINSGRLEDAKSNGHSLNVSDNGNGDPWNACHNGNYDPWDTCDNENYDPWELCESGGYNSLDTCGTLSWETETVLTQHITLNDSDCVLPKPPRTVRKASIARYSRAQNPVKTEGKSTKSTTEVENDFLLPKAQRTNRRPRVLPSSWEQSAPKLKPEVTLLPPELEAWNAVEDPLPSWQRKQNVERGKETAARGFHKLQTTSLASGNIHATNNEVLPGSAKEEDEQLISKQQRERRIRGRK